MSAQISAIDVIQNRPTTIHRSLPPQHTVACIHVQPTRFPGPPIRVHCAPLVQEVYISAETHAHINKAIRLGFIDTAPDIPNPYHLSAHLVLSAKGSLRVCCVCVCV